MKRAGLFGSFVVMVFYFQNCGSGFTAASNLDNSGNVLVAPNSGGASSGTAGTTVAGPTPIPSPTPIPYAPPATSLRAYASAKNFYIGSTALVNQLANTAEPLYKQTLTSQFNMVTPENAMKWATIHPQVATYDFSGADAIADVALAYGMKMRGHNLAWYSSNPTWLVTGNYTPTQLSSILQDHINTVVGHYKSKYPGQVIAWDVVNEAISDPVGSVVPGLRTTIWSTIGTTPTDYMALAFQTARAADPSALLYYNDYSNDFAGPKATATYNLVSSLKAAGVPIDAVGLQSHIGLGSPISTKAQLMAIMAQYAAIGIKVSLTEFDMSLQIPNNVIAPGSLALQTSSYHDYLAACMASPNCVSFTTWGVTDKYSWIPQFFAGVGDPLIFDDNYVAKPTVYPIVQQTLMTGM